MSYKKQCSWPWTSTYLSKTGDIVPCCIIGDEKVESFGNINSDNFSNIWNSSKYIKFRNEIKNNQILSIAKIAIKSISNNQNENYSNCIFWIGRK